MVVEWNPSRGLPDEARRTAEILSQIAWFNRLRLLAGATVVWLTALAAHGLAVVHNPWPLYGLGSLILVVDGVYLLWFPRLAGLSARRVRRHVDLQIAIDLLILTTLLHFTGGITNPLVSFYLFHAFIAALVLSVQRAWVVALVSLLLVTLLGLAERLQWLPHHPLDLGLMDLHSVRPLGFWFLLLAYAMTMGFSIYFVATVLQRLRRNEQELVRLGRHLALSERLASVGTLAAGVSHEINNPVGVIRNKVQILRYRIQDGDDAQTLLAELDVVDKHARRINVITEGLLAFSREAPFTLHRIDLNAVAREAADLVRVPFRSAGVELDLDLRPGGVPVDGSTNHLLQVLVNMLLNAKDASAEGSRVGVTTLVETGEAILAIRDHGSGIPEANLGKIFDPFFTTKDVDKGTGLGLAISHGLVERHRGRIEVESEVGRGTVFRICLPLADAG